MQRSTIACLRLQIIPGQGRKLRWEISAQFQKHNMTVLHPVSGNQGRLLVLFDDIAYPDATSEAAREIALQQELADREQQRAYLLDSIANLKAQICMHVDSELVENLLRTMESVAISNVRYSHAEKASADLLKCLGRAQKKASLERRSNMMTGKASVQNVSAFGHCKTAETCVIFKDKYRCTDDVCEVTSQCATGKILYDLSDVAKLHWPVDEHVYQVHGFAACALWSTALNSIHKPL